MGPNNWATPQWLFNYLNAFYEFQLDVCAEPWNAKCPNYFSEEDNGLQKPWRRSNWLNPPYSGQYPISLWLAKALEEAEKGNLTVALVKNDPSTSWYSEYILQASYIYILYGARVQFEPPPGVKKSSCAFPSIVAVFDHDRYCIVQHKNLKTWKIMYDAGWCK
jgi:phage N-6-adenine-methyltransferase